MKKMLIIILGLCSLLMAETVENYVTDSDAAAAKGNLKEATEILETGIESNPNSADLYAQYGLYLSKLAGQASFMKAGMLSDKSFKQFNKALKLDPNHQNATLYRGILSVNVPKFMGKLNQGISDLELIQTKYGSNQGLYMVSSYYLGMGYLKNKEEEKAKAALKHVVMYGKESGYYEDAKALYDKISVDDKEVENANYYQKAMKFLEDGKLYEAADNFRLAVKQEPDNLELHLIFARTLGQLAEQGYDESISEDVTARAGIAHEVHEVLSRCVELAPGDDEVRFLRGSVAVNLPFFVNSLDIGITDLEYLSKNGKTDEMKGQSSFLLKHAKEMQQVFELAETGYEAETEEEKQKLLTKFIKTNSPIEQAKPENDYLQIEMTLGYRDQIAPQTAVWIEDSEGNYLKTLYISGFASHVKEHQMHLPNWAESSMFRNIEAVTGASIDCGNHLFYWDYTDFKGNEVTVKDFIVRYEICHWPHVQYQNYSLDINLNKSDKFEAKSGDFLIPNVIISAVSR